MDLPRHVDPKLAKGVLRQEIRGLRGGEEMSHVSAGVLDRLAMPTFRRGGKLSERDLDGIVNTLAPAFRATPTCLDVFVGKPRRVLTPSKAYRYVSGRFLDVSVEGTAHLTTVRVRIAPRGCLSAWGMTPYSFYGHAAERLLQRLPADKPRDPLMTVGRAIQASANLLAASLRPAYALPNRALAIPFGDGMLLGEVRLRSAADLDCSGFKVEDGKLSPIGVACVNASLLPDGGPLGLDMSRNLQFVTKTYIGPRELRPEQREFLERWNAFEATHGSVFAGDGWMAMHTGSFIQEALDADASGLRPVPSLERYEAGYYALLAMFREPSILRAMGATGPAEIEPRPFWQASNETNERMRGLGHHEMQMLSRGLDWRAQAPDPVRAHIRRP